MANNGFKVADSCVSEIHYVLDLCKESKYGTKHVYVNNDDGLIHRACQRLPLDGTYWDSIMEPFNCEIPGPSLTEQQQIEAINGLFPYAVAIIASAWAFKFIRGLIENWLRDRNSDD